MPSAWAMLPHCWASTERLGSAPRRPPSQQRPQPLPRGTACMPCLFQNLQGTCTPPETLCPGSGHSLACLCQAWPRFSSQPRPHASAQGSRNLDPDGIEDRLWAQLLFLGVSATRVLQRQPLMFGALQSKILLNERATCVIGTWVVVGVGAAFTGARDGCSGLVTAGT